MSTLVCSRARVERMKNGLRIRLIVYFGIILMLIFAYRLSDTFTVKTRDGDLPPVHIDSLTMDHLKEGRWGSALEDLITLFESTNESNLTAYIALCFRELGVAALLNHQYDEAEELAVSGLAFDTRDADLYLILGTALKAQSKFEAAKDAFTQSLAVDFGNAAAHKQMGEIHYLQNELEKAEAAWARARAFDPNDGALGKRLFALRKQLRLKETLNTDGNHHFSVTYDGEAMPGLEHAILEILESAYYDIGGRLQIYPKRRISVTLLTREDFADITGSPDWAGGLYEGQIKIPLAGSDPDTLKTVLYHEYTHAVLFDQIGSRCPWWLNEGLAQYLSGVGGDNPEIDLLSPGEADRADIPVLSDLGEVSGIDRDAVARSYFTALSGVRYFIALFGEPAIQKIILLMAEGNSFETAFHGASGYSFERFEEDFQRTRRISVDD